MKFNCIVSNPPYIRGKWKEFFNLSLRLSGVVASINPDLATRLNSESATFRELLKENGLIYHQDCSSAFPSVVSGRISAFILNKEQSAIDIQLPPLTRKLISKFDLLNTPRAYRGKYYPEDKDGQYQYLTNIHRNKLIWAKTNKAPELTGRYFVFNRFLGNTPLDPVELLELKDITIGGNILAYKAYPNETIEGFKSVWLSPFYRKALQELKQGFFDINLYQLHAIPRLDYSKVWTNNELENYFEI